MSDLPRALLERVAHLVAPTAGDIARAKRVVLKELAAGAPKASADLLTLLADEEGMSRMPGRKERIDVPPGSDLEQAIDANDPLVIRPRLLAATRAAIAELVTEGLLLAVHRPGNQFTTVPVQYGSLGTAARVAVGIPILAEGYQLSRRFASDLLPILDPDIFTAELDELALDSRCQACLREALEAFRRGLYLSAVNMLGAVSEGAWYAAGERLRGRNHALDDALDSDSTVRVIRLVAEEMAKVRRLRSTASELQAHAAYLRDLRNYGVHPRSDERSTQENAFSEAGAALLLLQTHRYLERLADAVASSV